MSLLELRDRTDLAGVSFDGVTELRMYECEPALLPLLPPHIEKLSLQFLHRPADNAAVDVALVDGALHTLSLTYSGTRRVNLVRLPPSLRTLELGGRVDVRHVPSTIESLSLWVCEFEMPLSLGGTSLKSLTVNQSHGPQERLSIAALPPTLEKLSLWGAIVESLPPALPALVDLSFDGCDLRAVDWDCFPETLARVSACRCEMRTPLRLARFQKLHALHFYMGNLRDVRSFLELPELEYLFVAGNPLSPDCAAALQPRRLRPGLKVTLSKPAEIDLTRSLYDAGINLSAELDGKKKVLLHCPRHATAYSLDKEVVLRLAAEQETAQPKLVGQAFIDAANRACIDAKKSAREARKKAKAEQAEKK